MLFRAVEASAVAEIITPLGEAPSAAAEAVLALEVAVDEAVVEEAVVDVVEGVAGAVTIVTRLENKKFTGSANSTREASHAAMAIIASSSMAYEWLIVLKLLKSQ